MYAKGLFFDKDPKQAAKFFGEAAEDGDAKGQLHLGMIFKFGVGVPKNYEIAASMFKKAADQGEEQANVELGLLYAEGNL